MSGPMDADPLERLQAALVANAGGCSSWEYDGADPAGGFRFSCDCGLASGTYATYGEGVRVLDGHLDSFPEAIREFIWSCGNEVG